MLGWAHERPRVGVFHLFSVGYELPRTALADLGLLPMDSMVQLQWVFLPLGRYLSKHTGAF